MQVSSFELVAGLAGLVSLGFNLFQLYRERVLRATASAESKLHIATLTSISKGLTEARSALAEQSHKGATSDAVEAIATRSLDSQRVQIEGLLTGYYDTIFIPTPRDSRDSNDLSREAGRRGPELITGVGAITAVMISAVESADDYIFVVGGRSRNDAYLAAVRQRVLRGDVRYVRILTGDHIRHPLCSHLDELWGQIELGYLPEDKYGGILATHDTVIIALQSSTVGSLDKGLRIHCPRVAADYRLHVLELIASSMPVKEPDYFRNLCTACRVVPKEKEAPISSVQPIDHASG
jgi:hypothetical protein